MSGKKPATSNTDVSQAQSGSERKFAPDDEERIAALRRATERPRAKRFYTEVTVAENEGGFVIQLDGRTIRTPGRAFFTVPRRGMAEAIAQEWRDQGVEIDPASMILLRLANTAIDRVADRMDQIVEEIVQYAGSDLLCYRADYPSELQEIQARQWDPVLRWTQENLGADFVTAVGVMHVAQPAEATAALRRHMGGYDAFELTALHNVTTLTGSAILALAHAGGYVDADEAWSLAHLDEDWQASQWGSDAEMLARRKLRRREFDAACRFLSLVKS